MTKRTIFSNKIISVFLAITILLGMIPLMSITASAATSTSVADPQTIEDWKTWFPEDSNRYSGGIYIDKSVYTAEEAKSTENTNYFSDIADKLSFGKDNFGNENFMISLSAIGSNTEIKGYSATPTDTMLVLDVSGSMGHSYTVGYDSRNINDVVTGYDSSYVDSMIAATNDAITTLQNLNLHNRVGVVLYSGNAQFGSSSSNTATVLLELGRYTQPDGKFIKAEYTRNTEQLYTRENNRWSNNRTSITYITSMRVETADNLKTSENVDVDSASKQVVGGTYIQNGLLQAYNQFPSGQETIIEDGLIQSGTQRLPIVVLMSDGAPTTATKNYNTIGSSDAGDGGDDTDSVGFLTQLTASWVKANLQTKYNGKAPKFYTLGVGTSNNATATGVLNPGSAANNASGFWSTLESQGSVNLTLPNTNNNNTHSLTLRPVDDSVLTKNYVDEYWTANDVDAMTNAFGEIVEEIIIQSRYYGTLVTSGNYDLDGYISFTDEIGTHMEVKDIKGIHIGEGTLVSGDMFSEFVKTGNITGENLTAQELADLETELTNAIMDRFEIDGNAYSLRILRFQTVISIMMRRQVNFLTIWLGMPMQITNILSLM